MTDPPLCLCRFGSPKEGCGICATDPPSPPEGDALAAAINELRVLTACRCRSQFALKNGHESECVELWREDVDLVATELTYRAVRIAELERDLADAQAILRALNRKLSGGGR